MNVDGVVESQQQCLSHRCAPSSSASSAGRKNTLVAKAVESKRNSRSYRAANVMTAGVHDACL